MPFIASDVRFVKQLDGNIILFCLQIMMCNGMINKMIPEDKNMKEFNPSVFVAVPLPGTGGWTGALIAALIGIDIKKASFAILGGIVIETMIMCIISGQTELRFLTM